MGFDPIAGNYTARVVLLPISRTLHIICVPESSEHQCRLKHSSVLNVSKINSCQNFTVLQNA